MIFNTDFANLFSIELKILNCFFGLAYPRWCKKIKQFKVIFYPDHFHFSIFLKFTMPIFRFLSFSLVFNVLLQASAEPLKELFTLVLFLAIEYTFLASMALHLPLQLIV